MPGRHLVPDIVGDRRRGFASAGARFVCGACGGQRRSSAGQVLGGMVTSASAVLVVVGVGQGGVEPSRTSECPRR
jgi:hypothetical protein